MILKSYIVEQNVEILKRYQATLIYGENNGIKNDVKNLIKKKNKDFEEITFFERDLQKNDLLFESINNQSLFSQKKMIFIQEASDKVFDKIKECLEKENKDIEIYIFTDNLDKRSKLRNLFEKEAKLAVFPCYEDNDRTLISYINKELKDFKGVTGEIINLIIYNSNMDRNIIKTELVKIKDFFLLKKINKEEILEILNIKKDSGFDEIRDKALIGEKKQINILLSETEILNEEAFFYLNNINYRIMRLYEITKMCNNSQNNYEEVLQRLKPPVFWKDKPLIIEQLKKWTQKKLKNALVDIGEIEILMKKNSHLRNDIIIKDLIITLTNRAATSSS